jgi:phosphoribosyl-dephospho-CoA transferase
MLGMMSNAKNPQQMVMNIAKQNPQMSMAMQMMGGVKDKKGMKQMMENVCKEKGINLEDAISLFNQQTGMNIKL